MTLQEMQQRKKAMGLTYEDLSRLSGVPLSTVQKVMSGQTKYPRRGTLEALETALVPKEECSDTRISPPRSYKNPAFPDEELSHSSFYNYGHSSPSVIREAQAVYRAKQPGEFTVADYLKLPDECRVELIDGVFYDMAAPNFLHQRIACRFSYIVQNYIDEHHGRCIPAIAPVDVQLDKDDKTMVQPDFLIVCHRDIITKARIVGAPDFVMEVISPSSRRKDMLVKAGKYAQAGVREYWMIDPEREKILVYDFTSDFEAFIYGLEDEIPVRIYDGDLVIDMKQIREEIEALKDLKE